MNPEFINLTVDNLDSELLCCIIRTKKTHPGVEAKRRWLKQRLAEGHVYRKLQAKATVFIEYAPLETAWVPVIGTNYLYLYCLWVEPSYKGHGYGKALMDYCLADAKAQGKSGVCMLAAQKQKNWLSDQSFAKKYGFNVVDTTANGYELLALAFDHTMPRFTERAKMLRIDNPELTIYYDAQCPFITQNIEQLKQYCDINEIPLSLTEVTTLAQAKTLPGVFNNYGVFYQGKFETVNLLDIDHLKRVLKNKT